MFRYKFGLKIEVLFSAFVCVCVLFNHKILTSQKQTVPDFKHSCKRNVCLRINMIPLLFSKK